MVSNKHNMTISVDRGIAMWLAALPKTSPVVNKILKTYYNRYVIGVFESIEDVEQTLQETTEEVTKHRKILNDLESNIDSFKKLLKEMKANAKEKEEAQV